MVYGKEWDAKCTATLNDVKGHADAVLKGCQTKDGVAGEVPFEMPNCPGTIKLMKTGK